VPDLSILIPQTVIATTPPQDKAVEIHHRLCAEYGCAITYFHTLDPLGKLISGRRFVLQARLPEWKDVRDGPVAAVQEAISACNWPEQKAPRIQGVLRELSERAGGDLSLEFLREWPVEKTRAWLESIPGVGPKTSAAVLSFSTLRGKTLPVDSHHHRVAARVGLISPKMGVGPAHEILESQLPADWDAQHIYDNHQMIMRHGEKICPYGQGRIAGTETAVQKEEFAET